MSKAGVLASYWTDEYGLMAVEYGWTDNLFEAWHKIARAVRFEAGRWPAWTYSKMEARCLVEN